MNVVLTMLAVVGGAGLLYFGVGVIATRKQVCPGCHVRGLESATLREPEGDR